MLGRKLLGNIRVDSPRVLEVGFISNKENWNSRKRKLFNVVRPASAAHEGLGLGQVEDDHHGSGAAVEGCHNRLEAFLS